jgi:hypothetical protein
MGPSFNLGVMGRRFPGKRVDDSFGIQGHHSRACCRADDGDHDERTLPTTANFSFGRSVMKFIVNISILFLVGLLFTCGLSSCSRKVTPVSEAEYATTIVGNWTGRVGDENEVISFGADGHFVAQVRRAGFISNTLGQGVTGTIKGAWKINGKVISLTINSAEDLSLLNKTTTSTIESFNSDRLVVKSGNGYVTTFLRD